MSSQSLPYLAKFAKFAKFTPYLPLLAALMILLTEGVAPAHAQGPAPTPTPYPAIEATRQAAQAQLDEANQQKDRAAQMDASAAELRRNAEAQQTAAQQAISDARAASVAQNAAAVGEAIGRAESVLAQLSATVAGQADIIATANDMARNQAQTITNLTGENQSLIGRLRDAQAVNTAQAKTLTEQEAAGPSPVVPLVVFGFVAALLAVLLVIVLQRRGQPDVYQPAAAAAVIDGEFEQPAE
jgi:uncharacterized coiled-coil protein SlyX